MRLLIATTNPGKLVEVRAILAGLTVEWTTLRDHPELPEAVEDASTFTENAALKALHYARLTGGWALADDSGLEVDALCGEPGVRSARFAGPACDDAANSAKLLSRLGGVPSKKRTARYRCAVALADPNGVVAQTTGVMEGLIVEQPRGANGFGYDPHFFVPDSGMTAAEMTADHKNRLSHRGQALRALRAPLERLLAAQTGAGGAGTRGRGDR